MEENNSDLIEENCLYQVVDMSLNGVFLLNTKNNKIFEEINMPKDFIEKIGIDCILRYKNGTYQFEEELTDSFFNSLLSIEDYEKIQNAFISENNIQTISPNTKFYVSSREEDYTFLYYINDKQTQSQIKVHNALLPFFIYEDSILYYNNGKFEIFSESLE